MDLPIPYFKQERKNSCGLAVLRMVFKYYGGDVTEKELLKDIKLRSYGTLLTDLGILALKREYKVTVHTLHLPLISPLQLPFGTTITENHLKKMQPRKTDNDTLVSFNKFIKLRGNLVWETPRIRTVKEYLNKKIPIILNYNTAAVGDYFHNWDNGHYIVINGIDDNSVSVLDPDKDGGKYKINTEELLPSWAINARTSSGHLMIITK
jgi:ABC-type bacteriocin/lantibiotic exporter with double-glycine peptidase domain